jgi:hypothetical protein
LTVGNSGISADRFLEVMASARTLPPFARLIAVDMLSKNTGTRPEITS